jgi:hypothetical protein
VPEIIGREVSAGLKRASGKGVTNVVAAEVAGLPGPPVFAAVSSTRIVWATSLEVKVYDWLVAPAI